MRFVCDSCRAQYMISDDKVGAKGVKVRCKKCGYVILVRRTESEVPEESTKISQNPFADGGAPPGASAGAESDGEDGATNPSLSATGGAGSPLGIAGTAPSGENVLADLEDDEIGAVFDQVLRTGPQAASSDQADGATGESPSLGGENDEAQSTRVVSLDTLRKLAEESEAKVGGEDKGHGANGKAEKGKNGVPTNDWFVAVDDQQVGPLTLDKLKDMWDRGQVGADSLCWRAGFSDWLPLSEVSELASVLAPRPAKPVIVAPAPVNTQSMSPVMSMPVESAFSAGGVATVERGAMQVMAGAPPPTESGAWKPSAASALASLAMQEVEAMSKPAPKAQARNNEDHAAAKGLLDLPAPDASGPNGKSGSFPSPNGDTDARIRMSAFQQPSYNTYTPPPAPAPEAGSSKKLIIAGVSAAAVVVVGLIAVVVLLLVRKEPQVMVAPPAYAMQQNSGASSLPMPPPPTGAHPVQPAAAAAPGTPAPAPGTTPAVAAATPPAAGTPAANTAAQPSVATPPPAGAAATPPAGGAAAATAAKSTLPPPPAVKTGGGNTELASARGARRPREEGGSGGEEFSAPSHNKKSSGGGAAEPAGGEDDFDKEFGGGGGKKEAAAAPEKKKPGTGYIPPAPGSADVPETLGQSDIMAVVVANKSAIVNCVNEQKKKDPGLGGRLVVRWTIQTSGKTSGIAVQSEEFKSTYMASCVTGLIRGWSFPRHKVQGNPIDFPFTF